MKVDPGPGPAYPTRGRRTPATGMVKALVRTLLVALAGGCATAPQAEDPGAAGVAPQAIGGAYRATLMQAERGDVDAMYRLALLHEGGAIAGTPDKGEMLRWLALSSTLGNGLASYKLYLVHADRAPDKALAFKELAARQGYYGPPQTRSSR